jgi:lipopolysaccharide transport system ATP-binding protein
VYSINISVLKQKTNEPLLRINDIISFQVIHDDEIWQPFLLKSTYKKI